MVVGACRSRLEAVGHKERTWLMLDGSQMGHPWPKKHIDVI